MKKFEYKQIYLDVNDINETPTKMLNILGNDGWELISIVDAQNIGSKDFKHFFLKKPLKNIKSEK
jgi:hypothetical protein